MRIDEKGVRTLETEEEFEAHLNSLPDGGAGVRAMLALEASGQLPQTRIIAQRNNAENRTVLTFATEAEATAWMELSASHSHPDANFERNGCEVTLPGSLIPIRSN